VECPANRLPVELLTRILGFVPHTDAIKSCSLVSRKWHAAAKMCILPQITLPKDFANDPRKLDALVR
jgi:hypothetical protein